MAGTWTPLTNRPSFNASTMLLLTDGRVLCQNQAGSDWWTLTPDSAGAYAGGIWQPVAVGPNAPLYYASAVLRDGRVFVAGGEDDGAQSGVDLLAAEIFDPVTNAWIDVTPPKTLGWEHIGDAPSCVLPDGRVLIGSIDTNATAIYDPSANIWTAAGPKLNDNSNEETWTLLPDETVITLNCKVDHPKAQKYVVAMDKWVPAGKTVADLVEASSFEIGPAVLLPDQRLFAVGATGATALYKMPAKADQPGSWTAGPSLPSLGGKGLIAKDAPACLLPNGNVLCVAGPATEYCNDKEDEGYCKPSYFFEFDPLAGTFHQVDTPENGQGAPYVGRMLLLPTGEVLFSAGTDYVAIYQPDGTPAKAWRPQIIDCPATVKRRQTYVLRGRQLNGLSQTVSYGDDAAMATNYPLIRLDNVTTGRVLYCRTHDHSTMGVATGGTVQSTQFDVAPHIDLGTYELVVIANGISSEGVQLVVADG